MLVSDESVVFSLEHNGRLIAVVLKQRAPLGSYCIHSVRPLAAAELSSFGNSSRLVSR